MRPEAAGDLAQLLVDDHLLDRRPAAPPDGHGEVAGIEAGGDRLGRDLADDVAGKPAAGLLAGQLVRLQDVDDEAPGALAELARSGPRA